MSAESGIQTVITHRTLALILGFALVIVALGGALAVYEAVGEHDARIQAEAKATADEKVADAAKANADSLERVNAQLAEEKQKSDALAAQAIAQISQQRAAATTPTEMAALIKSFSGQQPVITVQPATSTAPAMTLATLPLPALTDYETACQKCSVSLAASEADVDSLTESNANLKQQIVDSQTEVTQAKKEADAYKTALKGGTFWHRFEHDALLIGVSAGVGVGVGYAVHK